MSDVAFALSAAVLAQEYASDIVRQTNRETQFLKHIPIVRGSGKNCPFVVESSGQVAENYSEGADQTNFTSDAQASGTFAWGLYRAPLKLTQLALDAAASTGSPTGNRDLFIRELVNSGAALTKTVSQACFTGVGYDGTANQVAGLETLVGSVSANIGGIDRTTATYFRPKVTDPGSDTAVTLTSIRKHVAAIRVASGMRPNLGVCSPDVFVKLLTLFEASRRYVQDIAVARGESIKLDSGYTVVEIDGMIVIEDPDCTAKALYTLNTSTLELQYLPAAGSLDLGGKQLMAANGVPLMMRYKWLGDTGATKKGVTDVSVQLVCRRPNANGVIKHIDIA